MDLSVITYSVFIPLLNELHGLLKSVGLLLWLVIVFLTAVVKLILTPLTFKQIKSTKAMQVMQPKLKKLQDDLEKRKKYKDNPAKLQDLRMGFQQEMMSFYKNNSKPIRWLFTINRPNAYLNRSIRDFLWYSS